MIDRGLHIGRSGIHALAEIELQGERRAALCALRGYEREPGNLHELALQRCSHVAGHRRRACAGVVDVDGEDREIHRRQVVHGQALKADNPEDNDAQREHHRHDGTLDKGIG